MTVSFLSLARGVRAVFPDPHVRRLTGGADSANGAVNARVDRLQNTVLASPRVEFRILGPLEVVEDDGPVRLGHGKERALLALLLLRANEVVSTERLIENLWPDSPPATAPKALQVYVSRLRKNLGADVLATRPPGYAVVVAPEQLDLARFERLVEDSRGAAPVDAASKLRDALSLWRGDPLAEFADEPFAQTEITRLEELRLSAVEDRIDADLALGRDAELVAELESLVTRHPYRERLRTQLMLALYRSGRQADALEAYRDARRALTDGLGLEPGEDLKQLERQILDHDEALAVPAAAEAHVSGDVGPADASPPTRRRRWALAVVAAVVVLATAAGVVVARTTGSSSEAIVAQANSVAIIDPSSNRVVAAIPLDARPTEIAAYGDAIWVLHPDPRSLSLLSRSERTFTRTVGLGGTPAALAADRHGVWISNSRTATVDLIEPERLSQVGTIRTRRAPIRGPYPDAGPFAIGFESLWVASGDRTISRVDLVTGRVVTRIRDVEAFPSLGGVAIGLDSVWVAGPSQESLVTRIDPRRNAISARIFIQKFRLNGIAVGKDAVWVSDVGSDQVWQIDPALNEPVGATKVGLAPIGLAYGAGSIWVANSGDGTVSRIDEASGRVVATITVGGSPNEIVVTGDEVWVTVG
jgi:YVTN family beta-propeller protein